MPIDIVRIPGYTIDEEGKLRNKKTGKLIKGFITNSGYIMYNVTSRHIKLYAHRLVAEAYILNDSNLPCINHKDGNKLNNRMENLEWVTYSNNRKHAHRVLGIKVWNVRLTREEVSKIRKLIKTQSQAAVARLYGVSPMVISRIKHNVQKEYEEPV